MKPGKIVLENGEFFLGKMPAWQTELYCGEVVFTTGMSGYIESLTDPSFAGQILSFTYPLIGNYGVPDPTLFESEKIHARGVIVSEAIDHFSHFEAKRGLLSWLEMQKVPLLCEVDTRRLTKTLRSTGTAKGGIMSLDAEVPLVFPDSNLWDLVKEVSRKKIEQRLGKLKTDGKKYKVVVVDCGIKENILRIFEHFPLDIEIVPFDYDFTSEDFDGVFLSNGPGDPERCVKTIAHVRKILSRKKPIFGVCLGAQVLALAIGAKTYQLPLGHRGQNQPCLDLMSKRAYLTSQNHGYAIREKTLPSDWEVTFRHLNDQTVAGIAHKTLPYFAVQFHPEGAPGPHDTQFLFERFYEDICKGII